MTEDEQGSEHNDDICKRNENGGHYQKASASLMALQLEGQGQLAVTYTGYCQRVIPGLFGYACFPRQQPDDVGSEHTSEIPICSNISVVSPVLVFAITPDYNGAVWHGLGLTLKHNSSIKRAPASHRNLYRYHHLLYTFSVSKMMRQTCIRMPARPIAARFSSRSLSTQVTPRTTPPFDALTHRRSLSKTP